MTCWWDCSSRIPNVFDVRIAKIVACRKFSIIIPFSNGYVIEVRSQTEIGSFDLFRQKIRALTPTTNLPRPACGKSPSKIGAVAADHTALAGDKMYFAFPETRQLNDVLVDLTRYKLFEGPFLNAEVGSEKLTIIYKNKRRVLDFKKLSITE
jgi:hypothetical protein